MDLENIKYVINELNKSPFNNNFNIVSYDNLGPQQRFQILFQILQQIDSTINIESLEVMDTEHVVAKLLEMLRILKYNPQEDMDASLFRQNLVLADKTTFTHIFYYLLQNLDQLRKRAYLARFLVTIEVSPDVEGDEDIVQLNQQYRQLIGTFKTTHMEYELLKKRIESVQELQKDIKTMETEREQISEKLNNIKRKVDDTSNMNFLNSIREYIKEKNNHDIMIAQISQQKSQLEEINMKLSDGKIKLQEFESNFKLNDEEDLLTKIEEEIAAKNHLINQLLIPELTSLKNYVTDFEEIESKLVIGDTYVDELNKKIQLINKEINELMEEKILRNDSMNDKLAIFRQNAELIFKKKSSLKDQVKQFENELNKLKAKLNEIKETFKGEEILTGDELKKYVTQMKNKSYIYKTKRQELSSQKTELTILNRTYEILTSKSHHIERILIEMENQRGISGYFTAINEEKEGKEENTNLEEIKYTIRNLNQIINDKKAELAPLIKELRNFRQKCQDLSLELEEKKHSYQSLAADLETKNIPLQSQVSKLTSEKNSLQSEKFELTMKLEVLKSWEEIIQHQMNEFAASDNSEGLEYKLMELIEKEEDEQKHLEEKFKQLEANKMDDTKQLKMWKDLKELFDIKYNILNKTETDDNKLQKQDYLAL